MSITMVTSTPLAGYVAAKHGLIGLTKAAALDYAAGAENPVYGL
ncbi:hypothetical protein [Amycolatopsis sp.]|nr:hypothetical protein [Amycolatopsis sp.]